MRETSAALGRSTATHKLTKSKAWNTWVNIRQRCHNPKTSSFSKYGAKGIRVCERWHSFENFYADMGDPPSTAHTLDRIDPSGNYEPNNCRWATQLVQQNNRSSNRLITAFGKTQTLQQWSRETGFAHRTIHNRIANLGWSPETALATKPIRGRNQFS